MLSFSLLCRRYGALRGQKGRLPLSLFHRLGRTQMWWRYCHLCRKVCVCVFIVAHSARAQQRLYLCTVTLRHMQHLWIDVRLFDLASDSQIMSRIMTGKSVFQSLIFVIELSNIVIMLMWMLFFILTLQNFTSSDPVLFSCNCNSCCSTCLFNNQLWLLLLLTMWQVNVNCMYGNSQP